jgi:hypothetical protein
MIFYGDVRLIADRGVLSQLIVQAGPELLIALIEEGYLRITYVEGGYGFITDNTGTDHEIHKPTDFKVEGAMEFENAALPALEIATGSRRSRSRRLMTRLARSIESESTRPEVIQAMIEDLNNPQYIEAVIPAIIRSAAPNAVLPHHLEFEVSQSGDAFTTKTNLNLRAINNEFHKTVPETFMSFTPATLLSAAMEACTDLSYASDNGAELSVDPMASAVMSTKLEGIVARATNLPNEVSIFQARLFKANDIAAAVNSGVRSLEDVLQLLRKATRFRQWMADQADDVGLLAQYYEATTKRTWIETLPAKIARWSILGGGGLIATLMGVPGVPLALGSLGFGAADSLFLEKLVRGWRPDQFVDGTLRPFLDE